ncbi:hypothetical protein EBOKLHFM_00007 [Klebsiella phage KP13-26]|nr:hypothetical protein EBOKLHFM_00007 [Klebsiella phage KP13-26]
MATLHVVVYKHAVTGDDMIQVLVNGFCEMEREADFNGYCVVCAFLDSLVEMCVITHEQREAKINRLKKLLDIE